MTVSTELPIPLVAPKARKRGIGAASLRAAAAQAAYERHGGKRDAVFCVYSVAL